jgi:hypothetical protein
VQLSLKPHWEATCQAVSYVLGVRLMSFRSFHTYNVYPRQNSLDSQSIVNRAHANQRTIKIYLINVKLYLRKGISFQLTLTTQLGIIIVSRNSWSQQASPSLNTHHSLQKAFESLHPALKNICGTVQFPKDNGGEILRSVQNTKKIYMGLAMQRSETDAQHMHGLYHLVISMTLMTQRNGSQTQDQ